MLFFHSLFPFPKGLLPISLTLPTRHLKACNKSFKNESFFQKKILLMNPYVKSMPPALTQNQLRQTWNVRLCFNWLAHGGQSWFPAGCSTSCHVNITFVSKAVHWQLLHPGPVKVESFERQADMEVPRISLCKSPLRAIKCWGSLLLHAPYIFKEL